MAGQLHGQSARVVRSISCRIPEDAPRICGADGGYAAGGNREDARWKAAPEKELAKKEQLLRYVTAERAQWTAEARARLSARDRSLHDKAFTTNAGRSGLPAVVDTALSRWRRGAGNGHSERRSAAPVPQGCGERQAARGLVAGPAGTFSDHPGSPWYGAWYVAETLNILTKNPEVWKKTIFILTYDENDGYFDHVPPFVAPDPANPESGQDVARDRRGIGISAARAGSEAAPGEGSARRSGGPGLSACRWWLPRRGAAAGMSVRRFSTTRRCFSCWRG